ncbi:FixH family protein [Coleofasciculus chthonoplastes]|uniref:FixH family protein n=2 Tax=Coleofasciculus chthonoplastes TaxID=64178 RepID=UPI0032FFCFA1
MARLENGEEKNAILLISQLFNSISVRILMKKLLLLVLTISVLTTACSSANQVESEVETDAATAPTTETMASSAENDVIITMVSPEDGTVPMGDAEFVVEVIDPATNEPVAVEDLQVDLSMEMEDMEPMTAMTKVEPDTQPGRYKVMTNMGMTGKWMMAVKSNDPAMSGQETFDIEVK